MTIESLAAVRFVRDPLTDRVANHFRTTPVGGFSSWDTLSVLLGMEAQRAGYHHVYSAYRILINEGIVLGAIRGHGVKRLTPPEVASLGEPAIRKVRRAIRRALRKLNTIEGSKELEHLSPQELTSWQLGRSYLGMMMRSIQPQAVAAKRRELRPADYPIQRLDPAQFKGC